MSGGAPAHRRRAAWAILSGELDERGLMEAMQLQQDLQRGDTVNDIIAFVDAVGDRHGWAAPVRKRLYAAYFDALRLPPDALPPDPLAPSSSASAGSTPRMHAAPVAGAASAPPSAAAAPPAPASSTPSAPATTEGTGALPAATASASAAPTAQAAAQGLEPAPVDKATAHQVVFASLVMAFIQGVRQFHPHELGDLLADARVRVERMRIGPALRAAARDALVAPRHEAWMLDASADQMAAVVHELYISACEALGPVDADHLLMMAVRHAEALPQARDFLPSRLL